MTTIPCPVTFQPCGMCVRRCEVLESGGPMPTDDGSGFTSSDEPLALESDAADV